MKSKLLFTLALSVILVLSLHPAMAQTVHQVSAGENTLADAIVAAASGDIIELVDDGGLYLFSADSDKVEIKKVLTIRAHESLTQKPVIRSFRVPTSSTNTRNFEVVSGGSLTLIGLEFDGSNNETGLPYSKQAVRLNAGDASSVFLKVYDCYFHDYTENVVRGYIGTVIDTIVFENSIIDNILREGIVLYDTNTDGPDLTYALFENLTMTRIGREALKFGSAVAGYDPEVMINHVTMDSLSRSGDYRAIRMDAAGMVTRATIKNTIISNQMGAYAYSVRLFGTSTISYCDTFNVAPVELRDAASIGEGMLGGDPMYTDAANGDYTLMPGSPVLGMADDGRAMGDLRWDPNIHIPKVYQIHAGENTLSDAILAAESGDIIELVDNGGVYVYTDPNSDKILVDKVLTIRAHESLTQKPIIRSDRKESTSTSVRTFDVISGGSLTLMGLEFDGSRYGDGVPYSKQAVRLDVDDSSRVFLKVYDCYFHDYTENVIRGYIGTVIDTLIVENSVMNNTIREGVMMYDTSSDGPALNYFRFENVTMTRIGREAFKFGTSVNGYDPEVVINHVTMDTISTGGDYRAIRMDSGPMHANNVTIKNSIISNQMGAYAYSVRLFGTSTISYCDTFNIAPVELVDAASVGEGMVDVDPEYFNAAANDYRLPTSSPLRGAADDGRAMGDLRWEVDPGQFKLTLKTTGYGTVSADPAGPYYDPSTSVTITAVPDLDWKISSWEGVSVFPPDAATATVTMDADKTVTVNFVSAKEIYSLNVSTVGVGHVEFSPAPLDSANWSYYEDTEVTMTAVSDTTSMAFSEWTGDLTGSDNPAVFTMTGDHNITAVFTPVYTQYVLDVDTVGMGNVYLMPEPYADYGTYDSASVVMLIAEPLAGHLFSGWSGGVEGTNDTVTVTMDSSITVTATFTEIDVPGGVLEADTTMALLEVVDFARNNSQVQKIQLTTSGGVYKVYENIDVDFPLTIVAKEGLEERPKLEGNPDMEYAEGIFQIRPGGSKLTLDGLELYWAKYAIRTDDVALNTEIRLNDCYIHHSGQVWIKIYAGSFVDSLFITNCIFRETTNEGIYVRDPNTFAFALLENSTFIRPGREAFRARDNADAKVIINHCTFDSASWNQNYRVVYPEGVQDATIKNCIITNQMFLNQRHVDVMRVYGTSSVNNLVIFNASTYVNLEEDAVVDTMTVWEFDPLYENTAEMNYTLTAASHAYGLADDGEAAGDLNWATSTPTHVKLTVVVDGNGSVMLDPKPVGLTYDPDADVSLTAVPDSGYQFYEWSGDLTGNENPASIALNADKTVTAVFVLIDALEDRLLPTEYALYQNFPNPFNPQTTIKFDVRDPGKTEIKVFDILGREIATLLNKEMQPGRYQIIYYDPKLSTGVYFYQIKSGKFSAIRKMLLVK